MGEEKKDEEKPKPLVEEELVETSHIFNSKKYTVRTGRIPLKDEKDEIDAQAFIVAYTKADPEPERPLMFSFNGGPGSPSIWLHFGALGPMRAVMAGEGELPAPPYRADENPMSWLEFTDLVFIDPVGTGFSRAKTEKDAEKYWSIKGDIESVAEIIRLVLTRFERWDSPLFLVGESYGTTRAAGLAEHLVERGIGFKGIVLVSSILNFQTARFSKGNDLPYVLFFPTYCATAFYHGKLVGEVRNDLQATLRMAEDFAAGPYADALQKGDRLGPEERNLLIDQIVKFTGLTHAYVDQCDLRINIHDFCKELMRTEGVTVGRLDSRVKGIEDTAKWHAQRPDHDPSMSMLMPPYVSTFNQFVRTKLGYKTDLPYEVFRGIKKPWEWGSAGDGHPDVSEALRSAMAKNAHMKVFVASGYFDLATPYFATDHTLSHMGLTSELRANVTTKYYEAGHMMYVHPQCLEQLFNHVQDFVKG